MDYHIFIRNEQFARHIEREYNLDCWVDNSTDEIVYGFFDLRDSDIRRMKPFLEEYTCCFEIRNAESGDFIWPARNCFSLDQALDII